MFIEHLKSGARVQIQRPQDSQGFICKIEMFIEKSREVLIHAPKEGNRPVLLEQNAKHTLKVLTDNAIYSFNATVIARGNMDGIDVVRLRIDDDGEKIQRRSAFRFNCDIPVTFNLIQVNGQQGKKGEGIINDLSAGGAKIFTDVQMNPGSLLNISITLGDELVVALGDIRSKTEPPQKAKYYYQYGIRFSMMPESDKEIIIRFMYKKQREALKKVHPR